MLTTSILIAVCFVSVTVAQTPSLGGCPTVKTQQTVDLEKVKQVWTAFTNTTTPNLDIRQNVSYYQSDQLASSIKLDLHEYQDKYLGYWYEIESFPTTFEKGKCTRAQYTAKSNGHIEVFNRVIENGKQVNATGDAFRPDPNAQGKLLVQFAKGAPYSKYWVIHSDYEQFSLVFSCEGIGNLAHIEFAWILSRNTTLDAKITQQLKDELASYKIDVSKFKVSDQTDCPR